jgi:hypothetical protein
VALSQAATGMKSILLTDVQSGFQTRAFSLRQMACIPSQALMILSACQCQTSLLRAASSFFVIGNTTAIPLPTSGNSLFSPIRSLLLGTNLDGGIRLLLSGGSQGLGLDYHLMQVVNCHFSNH